MPSLKYHSSDFPKSFSNDFRDANTIPDVSWDELVWAAITVGKPEFDHLLKFGILSCYEMLMRIYMLQVNFMESAAGKFEHTPVYNSLDPSEKNALSYFMGLTMAKLLANRFLDTSWLVHLDRFSGKLVFKPKTKDDPNLRPDLIGLDDQKRWVVMEAKGRSNGAPNSLIKTAKAQTANLNEIDGKQPYIRVACAAYATPAGILSAKWADPVEVNPNSPSLNIGRDEFLRQYYAPIRNLISGNNPGAVKEQPAEYSFRTSRLFIEQNQQIAQVEAGYTFTTVAFTDLDIKIGLLNDVESLILDNPQWYSAYTRKVKLNALIAEETTTSRPFFMGPDGVLIELGPSWNSENMRKVPSKRSNR
jgi:hypothetical protein